MINRENNQRLEIEAFIRELEGRVSLLESKIDDLYMRPRMPYSQNAFPGDLLILDSDLVPRWG